MCASGGDGLAAFGNASPPSKGDCQVAEILRLTSRHVRRELLAQDTRHLIDEESRRLRQVTPCRVPDVDGDWQRLECPQPGVHAEGS